VARAAKRPDRFGGAAAGDRVSGMRLLAKTVVHAALLALVVAAPASAKTFVDAAGRSIEVPDSPRRVLAAGPPASVLLYAVAPETMTGWVRAPSEAEKPYLAPGVRDLPSTGRLTGRGGTANVEAVLAAKPDLIIDVGTVDGAYASLADRVQAQTGIPYVLIDGAFDKTPESLRALGALLGRDERATELAAYAAETIGGIRAKIDRIPENVRPRVYYGRGPDGLETAPKGSITTEALTAVGAINVAEGGGGLARVSPEQVLAWNPGVILALDAGFAAKARQDPLWAAIRAVQDGKVYRAPSLPFGWFDAPPGVNRLIGVRWLASVLYPDVFNQDLRAETKRFYKLFYHVDLDGDRLDALLKDAGPAAP
jgi:iron complex transport system substrate-binding protein